MLMRHAHEYKAKPRGGLAKRIVAVLASVAMLSGMGYATSAALAEDTPATVETTTDQSVTTTNESTDGKNVTDGTDADNAGDTATGTADTESDTNTGADADVNTANAANVGDATSSDANSQTDTTAQSNPQPVNAAQNSPSAVADVTDSNCIYAGTNALQRVCWLDMSKFNSKTAKTNAGQKMTVNLGGGLTMSFIAHYSGNRTVAASGVPTWDNRAAHPGEAGHHAIFGVEGYSDFPTGSKPALYQNDGYQNDSKIRLSDITINGQDVANLQYSFVMADAESTNKNEQMVYTSDSAITQLGFYPTDDSNYGFCEPQSSNDKKTITCTGKDGDGVPQGIRLYTTSAPTQVSIEMKNSGPGSRQGAAFGVIFSQAVAKITVNGLASGDTSTTFRAGVSNNEVGSLESDSISSNTAESSTLPILASAGVSKTVRFYLEGNPSDWSKYDVTFEGTDNGNAQSGTTTTIYFADATTLAGRTIVVSYQGTVTKDALDGLSGSVDNKATITTKDGTSGEGKTVLKTYGFQFTKIGKEGNEAKPLAGAKFVVKNAEGKFLKQAEDGAWSFVSNQNDAKTFITENDGLVKVAGLAAGTYTVVETQAPTGYAQNFRVTFNVKITDEGLVTFEQDALRQVQPVDNTTANATATVLNVKNVTQLPLTGAAGTVLFTVVALLVGGAGVAVAVKSRRRTY